MSQCYSSTLPNVCQPSGRHKGLVRLRNIKSNRYGFSINQHVPLDNSMSTVILDAMELKSHNSSLHIYSGTWSSPTISGTRPPPCSFFSITKVDEDNAVLFGGRGQGNVVTNHIYNINLKGMVSIVKRLFTVKTDVC